MFKGNPLYVDTFTHSITFLIHCPVVNVLMKVTSVFKQSCFRMIFELLVSPCSATSTHALPVLQSAYPVVRSPHVYELRNS